MSTETMNKENVAMDVNKKPQAATKDAPAKKDTSPYGRRMAELEDLRQELKVKTGEEHLLWIMHSEDRDLLAKYGLREDEEPSEEDRKKALAKLTQKQVDDSFCVLLSPRSVAELENKYQQDIMYADDRNDRESGFIMLNTHSSWCMYPVIGKQLTAAVKEVNKAIRAVPPSGTTVVPGVAKKALQFTLAAVFAAHDCDHWRCDTESPEEVEKIAKRVTKLLKDLLWFTDSELGFEDPYSRKGLLARLNKITKEWKSDADGMGYEIKSMNIQTAKNQNGLGRSIAAAAPSLKPPPAKKAKTVASFFNSDATSSATGTTTTNAATGGAATGPTTSLVDYVATGIHDKLSLRVKTYVQLKVTDLDDPKKTDQVVVSGATCMKKINHLVAFLTGTTSAYQYHSQKGASVKGSRLELNVGVGYTPLWLAEKSAAKKATAAGADALVDKTVKIVQVFQGLNCDTSSGMVFDSELAKKIATTPNALVFVDSNNNNKRYGISVKAIVPVKTELSKPYPMPRVVTFRDGQRKTGFGLPLQQTKGTMQGDRKDPTCVFFRAPKSEMKKIWLKGWTRPLCDEDGSNILCEGMFRKWSEEKVATAGRPTPY